MHAWMMQHHAILMFFAAELSNMFWTRRQSNWKRISSGTKGRSFRSSRPGGDKLDRGILDRGREIPWVCKTMPSGRKFDSASRAVWGGAAGSPEGAHLHHQHKEEDRQIWCYMEWSERGSTQEQTSEQRFAAAGVPFCAAILRWSCGMLLHVLFA